MYGFRYHLITVVAIFMALAVGLLLGVALVRSDAPVAATDSMVSSLQQSFDTISGENSRLSQELSQADSLSQALLEEWADGRLEGQTVVVLTGEDDEETARLVGAAVAMAGGQAVPVTLSLPDSSDAQAVSNLAAGLAGAGVDVPADASADQLRGAVADALASEWASAGGWAAALPGLAASGSQGADGPAASSGGPSLSSAGDAASFASSDAAGSSASQGRGGTDGAGSRGAAPSSDSQGNAPAGWEGCPVSAMLEQGGFLSAGGDVAGVLAASRFVDVATDSDGTDPDCLQLLSSLRLAGAVVAAAQIGQGQTGVVGAAWDEGIAGAGSLERQSGAYALLSLLTGGANQEVYGVDGSGGWPSHEADPARGSSSCAGADRGQASLAPVTASGDGSGSSSAASSVTASGDGAGSSSPSDQNSGR